jgi:hypothetical protein
MSTMPIDAAQAAMSTLSDDRTLVRMQLPELPVERPARSHR